MRFKRYSRGSIVAYAFDDNGAVGLQRPDGLGLIRTSQGIPRSVVDHGDIADLIVMLSCIVADLDEDDCAVRGVQVVE